MNHFMIRLFLCLCLSLPLLAQNDAPRRKGKLLRTEVRKTDTASDFTCALKKTEGYLPCLTLRRRTVLTHHEVKVFEALREVRKEEPKDAGPIPHASLSYEVIPGETIEGEETLRTEEIDKGPLANAEITVQGVAGKTDAEGLYIDGEQHLLNLFDDMKTRSLTIKVTHGELGEQLMNITRELIIPIDSQIVATQEHTTDIIKSLGLDFVQQKAPSHDGLILSVRVPEKIHPGERISIMVTVENQGSKLASNLLARSFSREAWLNGRLFYFGTVQPNSKQSFTRIFRVPEQLPNNACFATIASWDVLGPLPKQQQHFGLMVAREP